MFNLKTIFTLAASLIIGLLCSMLMPLFSLVLAENYGADAFKIGLFYIGLSVASIIYAQIIAVISDKLPSRVALIVSAFCSGSIACFLFSISQNYWLLLVVGFSFYSFSFVYISQVMAHTKEFADQGLEAGKTVMFNAIARACFALAWVAGPPIGFALYKVFGFIVLVKALAFAHLLAAILTWFMLPRVKAKFDAPQKPSGAINLNLIAGVLAFALLYGTNHSYMLAMPHYLNEYLNLPGTYTGLLMGIAAALEVPIMLFGGWLAMRIRLLPLMQIGAVSAMVLYLGFWAAQSLWQLFALQIFNAIFIGFIAGLGMSWLQNLMPNQAGLASAYYSNSAAAGNVIGAGIIALIAQLFGYKSVYLFNVVLALVAFVLLLVVCRESHKAEIVPLTPAVNS